MEQFVQQMKNLGYEIDQARKIIVRGITAWRYKIKHRALKGKGFYRSAKSTLKSRTIKKLMERETWYKGEKRKYETDKEKAASQEEPVQEQERSQKRKRSQENRNKDEPETNKN